MTILEFLYKKRLGHTHSREEIFYFVQELMAGHVPDYQVTAWLMAACIQGLTLDETTWLTDAYVQSGEVLEFKDMDCPVVDKHSTGGVGDKTTLILVPLLASCGVKVAKLSGRGLGFTGGTIDKLDAIPGFSCAMDSQTFIKQLKTTGAVIASTAMNLAPADGKIYALRDVTSTVDHIPLIAASVVSKKIAAGADVIVLDIKVGRGAFMKSMEEAQQLAETCREIGRRLGRTISTVISNMDHPLGNAIGHTVEVEEAIRTLRGEGPEDLEELCLTLGGVALVGAGVVNTLEDAKAQLKENLHNGKALDSFRKIIAAQKGEVEVLEDFNLMPQPERITMFPSPQTGYIKAIDSLKVAEAVHVLGAGRQTKESEIDLGVGVVLHRQVGDFVEEGDRLLEVYVGHNHNQEALEILKEAIEFSAVPLESEPALILDVCLAPALSRPAV